MVSELAHRKYSVKFRVLSLDDRVIQWSFDFAVKGQTAREMITSIAALIRSLEIASHSIGTHGHNVAVCPL
jgi:hypothetical protein